MNTNARTVIDDSLVNDYLMFRDSGANLSSFENRKRSDGQQQPAFSVGDALPTF